MTVKIYVGEKKGRAPKLAAEINPSLFGLQETLSEIVAKATFHEWDSVAMVFKYEEKVKEDASK